MEEEYGKERKGIRDEHMEGIIPRSISMGLFC
jgi:hypothetical protein